MTFNDTTRTIVIGGNSGIGRSVAGILDARPGEVVRASRKTGLDIADPASVRRFFAAQGTFDHLIITAGSQAPGGTVADLDLTAARAAFDTKFWGTVTAVQAAAPQLRKGGTITLTTGFLARKTVPGTFVKTAMNAGLEVAVRILARELAPIRVNAVSPGLTDTEAYAAMSAEARAKMLADAATRLPAGRVATARDLAAAYLFLIDNPSATGATIDVDGGALIN